MINNALSKVFIVFFYCFLFLLVSCNTFKSENSEKIEILNKELVHLNKKFKNSEIVIGEQELYDSLFAGKTINSILVYYDADCWICFEELTAWKEIVTYFKKDNINLNIKFILSTEDEEKTNRALEKIKFSKSLIIYDKKNSFVKDYNHVEERAFNTMLLDKQNKILFIGSPLNSENVRNHYSALILKQ